MPPIGRETSPGHRVISASMVPDALMCPHCGSPNFVLIGHFQRIFEQPYINGKLDQEHVTLGQQALQTIEGIACKQCNIHTIIEEDEVFEREMLVFDLQTQVATLQGRVATSSGKEYKN